MGVTARMHGCTIMWCICLHYTCDWFITIFGSQQNTFITVKYYSHDGHRIHLYGYPNLDAHDPTKISSYFWHQLLFFNRISFDNEPLKGMALSFVLVALCLSFLQLSNGQPTPTRPVLSESFTTKVSKKLAIILHNYYAFSVIMISNLFTAVDSCRCWTRAYQ